MYNEKNLDLTQIHYEDLINTKFAVLSKNFTLYLQSNDVSCDLYVWVGAGGQLNLSPGAISDRTSIMNLNTCILVSAGLTLNSCLTSSHVVSSTWDLY